MTYLLDTNVWLALALEEHPGHRPAHAWLKQRTAAPGALLFCRATEQSLLRLLSTTKILNAIGSQALNNQQAIEALEEIQRHPDVATQAEPASIRATWLDLASRPTASPKLWMDAYLAAFAITASLQMVSFDQAFRQFENHGLKLELLSQAPKPAA